MRKIGYALFDGLIIICMIIMAWADTRGTYEYIYRIASALAIISVGILVYIRIAKSK